LSQYKFVVNRKESNYSFSKKINQYIKILSKDFIIEKYIYQEDEFHHYTGAVIKIKKSRGKEE